MIPNSAYEPKRTRIQEDEENALIRHMLMERAAAESAQQSTAFGPAVSAGGAGGSPPRGFFKPDTSAGSHFSADVKVGVVPYTVTFGNDSGPDVVSYFNHVWNFGDGGSDTTARPIHTYTTTGSFKVELTSSGIYDSSNTVSTSSVGFISGSVPNLPVVSFTVVTSSRNAPSTATFTNGTTWNSTGALTYRWLFGDNVASSSAQANPVYVYAVTGSFTVKLEATGAFGKATGSRVVNFVSLSLA